LGYNSGLHGAVLSGPHSSDTAGGEARFCNACGSSFERFLSNCGFVFVPPVLSSSAAVTPHQRRAVTFKTAQGASASGGEAAQCPMVIFRFLVSMCPRGPRV